MADKPVQMETDPGDMFTATVVTDTGPRERVYVDANIHSDELKKKVLASVAMKRRHEAGGLTKKKKDTMPGLRIGYAFWGFLGDHKVSPEGDRLSTPDGNATYSWSVIWEAVRRGHRVIPMMPDRDRPGCDMYGQANFEAFAQPLRISAYSHLTNSSDMYHGDGNTSNDTFPELDVLILEWRFPIPGRNSGILSTDPGYQPDLDRQTKLLEHYTGTKCKVIVWDLDLKMTEDDERAWDIHRILETSIAPTARVHTRVRVEPPTLIDSLMEHDTREATTLLSYIGSRYERDEVIDDWIRPIANRDAGRGRVHFYGNWMRDIDELVIRWPGVIFHDRVTLCEFHDILRSSAGVPLLAKEEYRKRGFVTPRVWEALAFGSIPIGLAGHTGISMYTDYVAKDAKDLLDISIALKSMSKLERDTTRRAAVEKIRFMDVSRFMDVVEGSL